MNIEPNWEDKNLDSEVEFVKSVIDGFSQRIGLPEFVADKERVKEDFKDPNSWASSIRKIFRQSIGVER